MAGDAQFDHHVDQLGVVRAHALERLAVLATLAEHDDRRVDDVRGVGVCGYHAAESGRRHAIVAADHVQQRVEHLRPASALGRDRRTSPVPMAPSW